MTSGAGLDLKILLTLGAIGIIYILARSFGKYFGAFIGAAITKADKNIRKYLGITLLPQAGVAIGMMQVVAKQMPQLAPVITTVVLSATIFYELIGPVLTKISLHKAGEIS